MDIFEVIQLEDIISISSEMGEVLQGMKVPAMRKQSKQVVKKLGDDKKIFEICKSFVDHEVYEVRFFCALLLGHIAHIKREYLECLRYVYCKDEDWRVKEATAKAFDLYCANNSYENSLDEIDSWLKDPNENVRRSVSEGLRVWTARPYFMDDPWRSLEILSTLQTDNSLFVKKSVANCFSDIGKKYPQEVLSCFGQWNAENKHSRFIIEHGCRHLKKLFPQQVEEILNSPSTITIC